MTDPVVPVHAELLVDGLKFPEAPRWHDDELWFSDMVARRVSRVDAAGAVHVVVETEDMPGGLGFLPDGRPLLASMFAARLDTVQDATTQPWADVSAISGGHLDDMLVTPAGVAYVGAVGVMEVGRDHSPGQILRVTPDGVATSDAGGLLFPNGMALGPDGATLLLAETFAERIVEFAIGAGGRLGPAQVFADLPGLHPDGLTVDAEGAVWTGCYTEHRFLRVERGARITHQIDSGDRWATGVTLGGPAGDTLFLCSSATSVRRFFRGEAVGRIETARVDVPAPVSA